MTRSPVPQFQRPGQCKSHPKKRFHVGLKRNIENCDGCNAGGRTFPADHRIEKQDHEKKECRQSELGKNGHVERVKVAELIFSEDITEQSGCTPRIRCPQSWCGAN